MKRPTTRARVCSAALLLLTATLCGCLSYFENPFFTVKESGLNWIYIRHYSYRTEPVQRVSVRIDGNGIITVREGTSMLVTDPFAKDHTNPNWHDIVETRVTIQREEVTRLFQALVDEGLFKERRKGDSVNTNESIAVSANIQGKTCSDPDDIFGSDPDLAEQLKNIILMFHRPQPKRRR